MALSNDAGRVDLEWDLRQEEGGRRLAITWRERDGPVVVKPSQQGFGSRLIERSLAAEEGGGAELDYRPDGLVCRMAVTLPPPRR
jgi:two-component sensor histidine kinase